MLDSFFIVKNDKIIEELTRDEVSELYKDYCKDVVDYDTFVPNNFWSKFFDVRNIESYDEALKFVEMYDDFIDEKDTLMIITINEYRNDEYKIYKKPKIGDKVSYGFNGDYNPCGEIATISPTMKKITTTTGHSFYNRKGTATWKMHNTWTMVNGHYYERNPHI